MKSLHLLFCLLLVTSAEAAAQVRILGTVTNGFVHPGIGMTREILEDARAQVLAGRDPWISAFRKLAAHPNSSKKVSCRNQSPTDATRPELDAFDNKGVEMRLKQDGDKALRQALMYWFTGDQAHRANAMKIIRVWSKMDPSKCKAYSEVYIHASYPVKDLIMAAELMRYTSPTDADLAWSDRDTSDFTGNFVVPAVRNFFDQNGWFMNQDGYALAAAMSGDIFTSDRDSYAKRVEWFTVNRTAPNKGWIFSIKDLARLVTTNTLTGETLIRPQVQLMEMGRDQAHAGDDMEIFNTVVRMMNAQGTRVDPVTGVISTADNAVGPYEFLDDRILAAADYFSRFMLGYDTPWIPSAYDISRDGQVRGIYPRIADNYRGRIREHDFWDAYYYYTCKKGIDLAKRTPYYHEAFLKRIVSSDFEWVFIPKEATGELARVVPTVQEPDVVEVVERSSMLDTNTVVARDDSGAFLRVTPGAAGTRIAFLSTDTASKTVSLRIRTSAPAALEMSGFARPWLLPDTRGGWRIVSFTMDRLEHWGDIVFVRVKGPSTATVDIRQLLRKPDAPATAPAFISGNDTLHCVAYAGAPVTMNFAATNRGSTGIVYEISDLPEGAMLDSKTGAFSWKPKTGGGHSFVVTASAGGTVAVQRGTVIVASDRADAVRRIDAGVDPKKAYVTASVERYKAARAKVEEVMKTADDAGFFQQLVRLHQAGQDLEPLTPLLADGSMDFARIVDSSNIGESIGLLVDNNDDTFPVYSLAKDLNHTIDFGPGFRFSAAAFAMEGRLNFEDRMADAKFFGSNDGTNWTELTPKATQSATELTKIDVAAELKGSTFRYLRIQKRGGGLFEPAELRIHGQRQEVAP